MFNRIIVLAALACLAGIRNVNAYVMYYDTLASAELGRDVAVAVMAPLEYRYPAYADKEYPVLYALHGQGDGSNYTFWNNQEMKSRIMSEPMLVVMFNNAMSMYVDETEFFFNELIPWVDSTYRTLEDGENRSITGFSSGGYGAMHYMLTNPEMFSSAIPMSGAVDFVVDGFNVIQRVKDSLDAGRDVPPIAIFCGTEDFLLSGNQELADSLEAWGHDYVFTTAAGGHTGTYWEATCPSIVDYAWEHFNIPASIHEIGISAVRIHAAGNTARYDCRGGRVGSGHTGIVIAVDADGAVRKVLVR